jgi:hypothetical protein
MYHAISEGTHCAREGKVGTLNFLELGAASFFAMRASAVFSFETGDGRRDGKSCIGTVA